MWGMWDDPFQAQQSRYSRLQRQEALATHLGTPVPASLHVVVGATLGLQGRVARQRQWWVGLAQEEQAHTRHASSAGLGGFSGDPVVAYSTRSTPQTAHEVVLHVWCCMAQPGRNAPPSGRGSGCKCARRRRHSRRRPGGRGVPRPSLFPGRRTCGMAQQCSERS